MKHVYFIFIVSSLLFGGGIYAMEKMPQTIIFKNNKDEVLEISSTEVAHIPLLNNAFNRHKLLCSIGTNGAVHIEEQELQNFDLIKECLQLREYHQENINVFFSNKTAQHMIKVMEMATHLNQPHISQSIAQFIGTQFQSAKNRCEAFKSGQLASLASKSEILNLIGQAILKSSGAKKFWLTKVQEKDIWGLEQQLNNHLTPQSALLLLDAYENKEKGTPLSFTQGQENAAPQILREFIRPSFAQHISYKWNKLKPVYKWGFAGFGTTALCGTIYAAYRWYTSK